MKSPIYSYIRNHAKKQEEVLVRTLDACNHEFWQESHERSRLTMEADHERRTMVFRGAFSAFSQNTVTHEGMMVANPLRRDQRFSSMRQALMHSGNPDNVYKRMELSHRQLVSPDALLWDSFQSLSVSGRLPSTSLYKDVLRSHLSSLQRLTCEGWYASDRTGSTLLNSFAQDSSERYGRARQQHQLWLTPGMLKTLVMSFNQTLVGTYGNYTRPGHVLDPMFNFNFLPADDVAYRLASWSCLYNVSSSPQEPLSIQYIELFRVLSPDGKNVSSSRCKSFVKVLTRYIQNVTKLYQLLAHRLTRIGAINPSADSAVIPMLRQILDGREEKQPTICARVGGGHYLSTDDFEDATRVVVYAPPANFSSLSKAAKISALWDSVLAQSNYLSEEGVHRIANNVPNKRDFRNTVEALMSYVESLTPEEKRMYKLLVDNTEFNPFVRYLFSLCKTAKPWVSRAIQSRTRCYDINPLRYTYDREEVDYIIDGKFGPMVSVWCTPSTDNLEDAFSMMSHVFSDAIESKSKESKTLGALDILEEALGKDVLAKLNTSSMPATNGYLTGNVDSGPLDMNSIEAGGLYDELGKKSLHNRRAFATRRCMVRSVDINLVGVSVLRDTQWSGSFLNTLMNSTRDTPLMAELNAWIVHFYHFYGWNTILNQEIVHGTISA